MLIAQITDVHLGFEPGNPRERNRVRLDRVLQALADAPHRPDLLLVTGDIADRGDADSYAAFAQALAGCGLPVHGCVGNHDHRANFAAAFAQHPLEDGFAQYVIARDARRIVVLDTLEPGRQGGGFCAARAAWLAARLDEDRRTPTLLVLHHPPFDAGIAWMATDPREPWVRRLADAVAGHDQIVAIVCGHLHRAVVARWSGIPVVVCPATAPGLALDLTPIDPDAPDGRPMILDDRPGYALHRWTGDGLVSHFETVGEDVVLARFDAAIQPVVRQVWDERP